MPTWEVWEGNGSIGYGQGGDCWRDQYSKCGVVGVGYSVKKRHEEGQQIEKWE